MTPQEYIRSKPFALSKYLTPQDEAWIAAHMAQTVKQEQHNKGLTPGAKPRNYNLNNDEARKIITAMQRRILKAMADRKTWSLMDLSKHLEITLYDARKCCIGLRQDCQIVQTKGDSRSTNGEFRLAK